LLALPEFCVWLKKLDADAQASLKSLADVDHTAFTLGLIFGVGEAKPLAEEDFLRERHEATTIVQIQRECFFVERLLEDVGAVDEKRNIQLDALAMAPIAAVSFQFSFLCALDGASAMLLGCLQRVPYPAHSDPQGWPAHFNAQSIDANGA
jgi:hypothetical protein